MLTGRVPFDSDTPMAVLTKHAYEAPPPPRTINPNLPPVLEAMLLRVVQRPGLALQSAAEMAEDVERVAAQFERLRSPSQVNGRARPALTHFSIGLPVDEAVNQFSQLVTLAPGFHEDAAMLLTPHAWPAIKAPPASIRRRSGTAVHPDDARRISTTSLSAACCRNDIHDTSRFCSRCRSASRQIRQPSPP